MWLPAAIRYGIDIETFWKLNPRIMFAYQDAYLDKMKQDMKMMDVAAYYNGIYNMQAIGAAFSKKVKYPKKPFSEIEEEKKRLENMTEDEYYEAMRIAIGSMNKQFTEKVGEVTESEIL